MHAKCHEKGYHRKQSYNGPLKMDISELAEGITELTLRGQKPQEKGIEILGI